MYLDNPNATLRQILGARVTVHLRRAIDNMAVTLVCELLLDYVLAHPFTGIYEGRKIFWPCSLEGINYKWRGLARDTRFSLSMEISRLTRDGTAETVSRDQILRRERGQGNITFPCSAGTTSRIGNRTRLILTLDICVTIHI